MYDVTDLLPHKAPMLFISRILSVDWENKELVAAVDISKDDLFFDSVLNGVPTAMALEYMAQAIGCMAGLYDKAQNPNAVPRVGFVLGSRKITHFIDVFEANKTYAIRVKESFFDEQVASFECEITDGEKRVAQAIVNAYRPDNIQDFMKGYA